MQILFGMAICLMLAWYGWRMRAKQLDVVRGWVKTKGTVVRTGVKKEMRTPVGGAPGKWPMFSPLVEYRYKVGDREITGDTIRLYDDVAYWFSSREQAVRRGRAWKRGMEITVYYDPARVEQSALEAVTATPYLIMGFSLLWVALLPFLSKIVGPR